MITLQEAMEVAGYNTTGGDKFCWKCYGPNARYLDFAVDGRVMSIVFDPITQVVYEATVGNDDIGKYYYKLFNAAYRDEYMYEAESRNVDALEAYDGVRYVELTADADFLEKARAVMSGEELDERIVIEFDLDSETLFGAMLRAHELDITLNQYIELCIRQAIEKEELE